MLEKAVSFLFILFFFELKELENQRKSYLSKIALLTHFTQM